MATAHRTLRRLTFLLALSLALHSQATHIVGGDLGYEFIGETGPGTDLFRYKLKARFYLNCGASSSFPTILDWLGGESIPLQVGVYTEDPLNPNAIKQQYTIGYIYVQSWNVITPDLPDECLLGEGDCVEESLFEGEVILPMNAGGYHLYVQGFARNDAISNLFDPGNTGIGFYSFMPPPSIPNSSPVFTGTPVPFICVTETTQFSNAAIDADGDSLVFSFETPYDAQEEIAGIVPPPLTLNWTPTEVVYNAGFSATQPFGAGGTAYMDPETGASQYSATMIGNWVVAVEVKEYRNGQFIGRIRSDLQLLSFPCTNNEAPTPLDNELTTSYTMNAGDTLCFPMVFTDVNGDTVNVDVNGTIFDANLFNPPAQILGTLQGDSLLGVTFCWPTICSQGSDEPYVFSVLVSDGACPPGIYNATITVEVVPGGAQLSIDGPGIVCADQSTSTYCVSPQAGMTYQWTVTGGSPTTTLDGNCIGVAWGAAGIGQVTVTGTTSDCTFTDEFNVNVRALPEAAFSLSVDTTCTGVQVQATNLTDGNTSAQWSYNNSPVGQGADPSFILPFGTSGDVQLTVTDEFGCTDGTQQSFSIGTYDQVIHFDIPNVFSPNNDKLNDRFELITTQDLQECFTMSIFDRWGKKVFESSGTDIAWNGRRDGGDPATDGVYYYILKIDQEDFHGHVTLMR